jgi:hypothetical protein
MQNSSIPASALNLPYPLFFYSSKRQSRLIKNRHTIYMNCSVSSVDVHHVLSLSAVLEIYSGSPDFNCPSHTQSPPQILRKALALNSCAEPFASSISSWSLSITPCQPPRRKPLLSRTRILRRPKDSGTERFRSDYCRRSQLPYCNVFLLSTRRGA